MTAREMFESGQADSMAAALSKASGRTTSWSIGSVRSPSKARFDRQGVAEAFRMAMAYGFTTKEAQRLTQATIDFSAATGQGSDVMGRIALALGQVPSRQAGRAGTESTDRGWHQRARDSGRRVWRIHGGDHGDDRATASAGVAVEAILGDIESNFGRRGALATGTLDGLLSTLGDLKASRLEDLFWPNL